METLTPLKNNTKPHKTTKTYRKLGFSSMDTTQLVVGLKKLLANYQVHYHKLRNFHWNVVGSDFFELHQEFEDEYNEVKQRIDIVAERIRVFGIKPALHMDEVIKISKIQENQSDIASYDMVKEVLSDYEILHELMLDVINAALDTGDVATEHIVTEFITELEKRHWMFSSWIK